MEPVFNAQNDFSSASDAAAEQEMPVVDAEAKARQERRLQRGVKWMLGGAGTLIFSFSLNFLLYQAGADLETPMYILTSLGALGVLKGMADVFGM
jgi:hypothetical protein